MIKPRLFFLSLFSAIPNLSLVFTPLLLSPLIIGEEVSSESKCAFLVLLTATLWAFNPIPLPITSMFPIVLLPLLSLASTETACSAYLKGNNMLFLGCLALALAVEKSNLHQRVALKVLLGVSTQFNWILLCFMLTTASFSMWLVSTATVAMMLPIADEIFNNLFSSIDELNENGVAKAKPMVVAVQMETMGNGELTKNGTASNGVNHQLQQRKPPLEPVKLITFNGKGSTAVNGNRVVTGVALTSPPSLPLALPPPTNGHITKSMVPFKINEKEDESQETLSAAAKIKVRKMFYLCIAYSATIGSVSTLTANGPNLVMKDILEEHFENRDPVDYGSWLVFATPVSIIITIICWAVFSWLYFRDVSIPRDRQTVLQQHISKKYEKLGPMTFHELAVLGVFVVMIALYISYKPQFFDGWLTLFTNTKTAPKMASAAIFCVILLFFIPAKPTLRPDLKKDALLDWHTIQTKLEWGVLFIRGGGFAMADAVKTSGLSLMVGSQLSTMSNYMSTPTLIASLSVVANLLIEFMRTSATASVIIPVTIKLAENLSINPLKIIIPMATSCAYAFITPVGTTTNTLIYFHGNLSITEMIIPGLIAKTITMAVMTLNIYLFGNIMFDIDNIHPQWLNTTGDEEFFSSSTSMYSLAAASNFTTTSNNLTTGFSI